MSQDHIEFVELAQELIDEDGRTITLEKLSGVPAIGNEATPWKGQGAQVAAATKTVKGVFVPVASVVDLGFFSETDDLLKRAEQVLLVAPTDVDLRDMTNVVDASKKWFVEWVRVLEPGELVVLYAFGVRR